MITMPSAERWKQLGARAERLSRPAGLVLSLVLLVVVVRQAREADWSLIATGSHLSVPFWATFAAYYLLSPCIEWLIYGRLWQLGRALFPALLRKLVSNELLLDYIGDVQFLAWAQSRTRSPVSPFAAVKDVSILSALTGNLVTLGLIALAWPYGLDGLSGAPLRAIFVSLSVVIAVSSLILLFGNRLFSHSRRVLTVIGGMLVVRTVGSMALGAVMWHLLMPQVALTELLLLAALRMIVSRLPFVPSKDLLFAGLAVVIFGKAADISVATSVIASLVLATHLAVGGGLALMHVATLRRR